MDAAVWVQRWIGTLYKWIGVLGWCGVGAACCGAGLRLPDVHGLNRRCMVAIAQVDLVKSYMEAEHENLQSLYARARVDQEERKRLQDEVDIVIKVLDHMLDATHELIVRRISVLKEGRIIAGELYVD